MSTTTTAIAGKEIVIEGYLTKQAIKSKRNWKKRYFVLYENGNLSYAPSKGDPPKNTFLLGAKSRAAPSQEAGEENGFVIEGPTHDAMTVVAENATQAKIWLEKINSLIKQNQEAEDARRKNNMEGYAARSLGFMFGRKSATQKGMSSRNLSSDSAGTSSRILVGPKGSKKSITTGHVVKVGDDDNCYLDVTTMNFFKNRESFENGEEPLGKATLNLLV